MPPSRSDQPPSGSRREFVQSTVGLSAAALVASGSLAPAAEPGASSRLFQPGSTVLFQGDSITDAGRDRKHFDVANQQLPLGKGYAWLVAAAMLVDHPDRRLNFYNRGLSGNKVFQLAERWRTDCLELKPDVLSILIGVNDYWHGLEGRYDGTAESYEQDYHALLERTAEALPQTRLVICEPFVLRCGAVTEEWFPAFDDYRAAARRVSDATGATFVPFQTMFDSAIRHAPPEHWAADGVHPTAAGAALLAHTWLRTVAGVS